MAQVDKEMHDKFCLERKLTGYMGSAKTGDQVNQIFYKVAADLAGVQVSKAQVDAQQNYKAANEAVSDMMKSKQNQQNE